MKKNGKPFENLTGTPSEMLANRMGWNPKTGKPVRVQGLGDVVAKVAKPIARVADRVLGTNLANCRGCKSRQDAMNRRFPL